MDDNSAPPLPREVLEVLEALTTAEAFAEPIMMLAERLKDKQLGEKAGQVLRILVNEFVAVLKPLYDQLETHLKEARADRLQIMQEQHAGEEGEAPEDVPGEDEQPPEEGGGGDLVDPEAILKEMEGGEPV